MMKSESLSRSFVTRRPGFLQFIVFFFSESTPICCYSRFCLAKKCFINFFVASFVKHTKRSGEHIE